MSLTIEALHAVYADARATASADAAFPTTAVPPRTCRYCGKCWIAWAGGRLDGHARCVVPLAFQRDVLALYRREPALTHDAIAAACGVTAANVQAWLRRADRGER